jgi:hypothetical protein
MTWKGRAGFFFDFSKNNVLPEEYYSPDDKSLVSDEKAIKTDFFLSRCKVTIGVERNVLVLFTLVYKEEILSIRNKD